MSSLLCIHMLGARARWRTGGHEAAVATFEDFADLVLDTTSTIDVASSIVGDIESDWCAIVCPSTESALALGRRIFRRAWLESRTPEDSRLWLRGVVMPYEDTSSPRATEQDDELKGIKRTWFSPSTLPAMSALNTGFHGMRLLVADSLLNDQIRGTFRIPLGRLGVIPFRRMNYTPYPGVVQRGFQDFMWMAETEQEWGQYTMRMKQRMLWSAADADEFHVASSTQIVFHECDAILQSVARKNMMRRHEEGGPGSAMGEAGGAAEAN
jgi:hypothetical protein